MLDVDALVAGIRAGARRPLARAITLAESTREDHRTAAREVLARLGKPRDTLRIAVSGVPGAKSTFIEALGARYRLGPSSCCLDHRSQLCDLRRLYTRQDPNGQPGKIAEGLHSTRPRARLWAV